MKIHKKSLCLSVLCAMLLTSLPASASQDHHTQAPTSAKLTLSEDSIIDSINQLGELQFHLPKTHRFATTSGVAVAFTQLKELPIVDITVAFSAGAAHDKQVRNDAEGVANMVATMLTQGTKTLNEEAFIAKKESLGVQLSSGATKDDLQISLRSLAQKDILNQSVDLLIDALSEPAFDTQVLERNKRQLSSSLKQKKQNPAYVAAVAFNETLYANHPYAGITTGNETSVAALQREDLLNFYHKFIGKETAKITMTGDLTLAQAQQIAEKLSAALAKVQPITPIDTAPSTVAHRRHIHITHPSSQTQVIIGHLIDKNRTDTNSRQQMSDFTLVNDVLAGRDFNARLMKTIREERGYTYGIYGNIERLNTAGAYTVRFSTQGELAKNAIKDTIAVIEDSLKNGISEDELELVRLNNKNNFPEVFSSNASIHAATHQLFMMDYPEDHLATKHQRLDKATLDSVNQVLRQTIKPNEFLIITVGSQAPDLSEIVQ